MISRMIKFPKKFRTKSGHDLLIRRAKVSDAANMLKYIKQMLTESNYMTSSPQDAVKTLQEQQKYIKETANSQGNLFLVSEIEGQLVGMINFKRGGKERTKHSGEFGISVLKDYWGEGIGNLLLDCLLNYAQHQKGIKKINLRVRSDNNRAIGLYIKKGFKKEGLLTKELKVNNRYYDLLWMGLQM